MKKLELLGLQPSGDDLTLTDEEGNRYSLHISDELRAALRHDRRASAQSGDAARQMTPREIQALVRSGKSLEEVSELSDLPAEKIEALAHPIVAEREYTARTARSYTIGREIGALTVEEIVASRLLSRGVSPSDITWDAVRATGGPWTLIATFVSGDKERRATWRINTEHRTLEALDDEGTWLSETQIPAPSTPWRHANTPLVSNEPPVAPPSARIDDVLASLDAQRGKSRPMPKFEEEAPDNEPSDESVEPEGELISLPQRPVVSSVDDELDDDEEFDHARSAERAESEPTLFSVPEPDLTPAPPEPEKKRRPDRPQMPSWDEIVFGKRD